MVLKFGKAVADRHSYAPTQAPRSSCTCHRAKVADRRQSYLIHLCYAGDGTVTSEPEDYAASGIQMERGPGEARD